MEIAAEALLSSVFDFLLGQLASPDLMQFAREERVHAELNKWQKRLVSIRMRLSDAEEKQITDDHVKSWLNDLRALVYDMEDVMDEFGYEVARRKLMAAQDDEPGTSNRKRFKLIPTCCTNFSPTHTVRLVKMGAKIRNITARLLDITVKEGELDLKEVIGAANPAWQRSATTTPIAYEPGVYGRDEDQKAILDLLGNVETYDNNYGVISIVGPGGVGKTTLARQIYNNEAVVENFDLKAWTCVSDVFHLENITKSILSSVKDSDASGSSDFQQVQRKLRDALANKKFLLVLDDVWTENPDHWTSLRAPLSAASKGSKVIVTTRHRNVGLMMGPLENLYELKPLSLDDCWSVFEKEAFEVINVADHPNLMSIGRKIVARCGGFPLAAKALGGLLRTKQKEEDWERVLNSEFWKLPNCRIFPALHLSYHYLPSYLKRCFAYCAIFPRDYEFDQDNLVLLWMAEGLIWQSNSHNQSMEDQGDEYFHELLSRSFFQSSGNNNSCFVMHDLIHDLAQDVSSGLCFCWEDNLESQQQSQIPIMTRHLSFTCGKFHLFKKPKDFQMLQHLRTFTALPILLWGIRYTQETSVVHDDLMSKFQQLRVLSLSEYMISMLPDSIGGLKHLRHLNLSSTQIESLPNSMTNLYNLQTLVLSYCKRLRRLPNDIGNMIRLRHLYDDECPLLQEMPQHIGKLKQLRTLCDYKVGKRGFLGIKELKDLSNLKGKIQISGLENVMDVEDAKNSNLKDKLKIEELSMIWGEKSDGSSSEDIEEQVLCSLQPNINLKDLRIEGYGGGNFSNWISNPSYSKLVVLSLIGCKKCKSLPPVGQLPSLKDLSIQGLDEVESVGVEFEGRVFGHNKPFQCLESLSFKVMKEWKEWSWSSHSFCSLRQLEIWNCPKLVGKVPVHLTSLLELHVDVCPEIVDPLPTELRSLQKYKDYSFQPKFNYYQGGSGSNVTSSWLQFEASGISAGLYGELKHCLPSAVELVEIDNTGRLKCEWVGGIGVGNLQSLQISGYKQLEWLGKEEEEHGPLLKLTSLGIYNCESLRSLPGWIMMRNNNNSSSLTELRIFDCPSLICFPRGPLTPTLKKLVIKWCENLASLPEDMGGMCGLEELEIEGCPSLVGFPKGPLTPTLKQLSIWDCENFECLPEHMNRCVALEDLRLEGCPRVIGFPEGGLPPTLKRLRIYECEKLGSLPQGIMQMHPHPTSTSTSHPTHSPSAIESLSIRGCPSLRCFPSGKFPSTLKTLRITDCVQLAPISNDMFDPLHNSLERLTLVKYPNLNTIPHHSLHSLKYLNIQECENLELQPHQFRNLTSLVSLCISRCQNIKTPLSEWGLAGLTSLTKLSIGRISPEATTFFSIYHNPLPLLPTTLRELSISGFQNLESLASLSLQTLTSLRELYIFDCPKLHSFIPKEGLPDMLFLLEIRGCPLLTQRCSKETGEDWPKVAHIPSVYLDGSCHTYI